jgi:probable F420-dependent oxidoreductase
VKHWFTYPLIKHPAAPDLMSREGVIRVAQAAEAANFDGMGFTDHPAPSQKWLQSGGHDALDPFVALAVVAGATEHLRLIPNIVVLPYRNPFVVAKAAATLDLLSGGRFILSTASGYLRSEYRALGVEFDNRNELYDDALRILRGVWSDDQFSCDGLGFTARDVNANPKPVNLPIWIGGNSARARRRVVAHGDGWNPFPAPASLATTARTVVLETLDDLAPMLDHLWLLVDEAGRDRREIDVAFTTGLPGPGNPKFDPMAHGEALDRMSTMGITWTSTSLPGDSVDRVVEAIEQYGAEVIRAES